MTDDIDISRERGLSDAEAAARLATEGPNELPTSARHGTAAIAASVIFEPIFLLLIAGGLVYLLLGDVPEALALLGFVFVIIAITVYQERRTERALEALRELSSPRALVIRDGRQARIAGREVVRGDRLLVAEGDRVPADAEVLSSANLYADESLLTGESAPVRKRAGTEAATLFAGTLVTRGQGLARVFATGAFTEMGKIGKTLETRQATRTPLQRQTGQLVRGVAVIAVIICLLVVVGYGLTRGDWLRGVLAGIALAMAVIPEEFGVVLTVFLALGAWRIAQYRVLTRRVPAVETLGAATVLCADKTGTLTMNHMAVRALWTGEESASVTEEERELPDPVHPLVEYGILASRPTPYDPMEQALLELGERSLRETEHLHGDWTLVREYPLSEELLAMSQVWRSPENHEYVIAAKGAPEAIADLCHLPPEQTDALLRQVRSMADAGLRVLAVARALFVPHDLPEIQHDFTFNFIGLIGLADPVRPAVPAAIAECYRAGVRVVMITGDYPGTAQHIAREIGLRRPEEVMTGQELAEMDELELRRRCRTTNLFARMVPAQKLRLVEALKANGEIVAMTGDGVNDAPALKAAHIGIAMGRRGTDVAREAADLVLLDDDFASIVAAVAQGRRIFDNMKKAMAYIIAVHIPIAGMSLLPVLFFWPLVLLPVHIVFLELVIDPACSVVFEAEPAEADVMRRRPRQVGAPLFSRGRLFISLLQGGSVLAITLAVFLIALGRGQGAQDARTLAFTTLVIANIGLIFANRSWSRTILGTVRARNRALWWTVGGALVLLALVLYTPMLRRLFDLSYLHGSDLLLALVAGLGSILWFEALKKITGARATRIRRTLRSIT